MSGGVIIGFVAGLVGATVVGVLTNLLTREAEGWIDALPSWLLRLAGRRVPASHRDTLYDEWAAELHHALHGMDDRPLSRLLLGLRYAAGVLCAARRVAKELGPVRHSSTEEFSDAGTNEPVDTPPLAGRQSLDLGLRGMVWSYQAVTQKRAGDSDCLNVVARGPDSSTLAVGFRDGTVRLWDAATGRQAAILTRLDGPVMSITYNADSTALAAIVVDHSDCVLSDEVWLMDAASGQPTARLTTGHRGAAKVLAFSPGGTILATSGYDGTVRLWDTTAHQQTAELIGYNERSYRQREVHKLAYSPDGTILATGGFDGTVRLWDTTAHQQTAELTGKNPGVEALAYSPDGTILASSGSRKMSLWDPATGHLLRDLDAGPVNTICPAAIRGRAFLAAGGKDRTIRIWDVAALKCCSVISVPHPVDAMVCVGDLLVVRQHSGALAIKLDPDSFDSTETTRTGR